MLTEDQASIIHGLAVRALTFDGRGLVVEAPPGFELNQVADALATLEAARDGAGGRALVRDYLGRLAPDLRAGAIDAGGTPSSYRLAHHEQCCADVLAELGGAPPTGQPHRWIARRGAVELDLPTWLPLEVLDSLARIGEALAEPGVKSAWSAPTLASEAERQAGDGRRGRAVLDEVGRLLRMIERLEVVVNEQAVLLTDGEAALAHRLKQAEEPPDDDLVKTIDADTADGLFDETRPVVVMIRRPNVDFEASVFPLVRRSDTAVGWRAHIHHGTRPSCEKFASRLVCVGVVAESLDQGGIMDLEHRLDRMLRAKTGDPS